MSVATLRPTSSRAATSPVTRTLGVSLDTLRHLGLGLLGLQAVALAAWSALEAGRSALSRDFSIYYQAFWLIGHGHLTPFDTPDGFSFWASHGELLFWPLALAGRLWPHPVTLLWLQDAALVGAETVALGWTCDVAATSARERPGSRLPALLVGLAIVLLVADPWVYWTAAFDFHFEVVGLLFVLLAARELWRDPTSRRLWLWAALALASGDVVTTYLFVVALGGALAGARWRRRGLELAGLALAWEILLAAAGADKGSGLIGGYAYLALGAQVPPTTFGLTQLVKGVAAHPGNVARALWTRRLDIYAALAAPGLLGVASRWIALPALAVVLENALNRSLNFLVPGFQDLLVYLWVPVGTVVVLAALGRRRARLAAALAVAVGLATLGWAAVWLPRTPGHWLRVSAGTSSVLATAERRVPAADEVVASQGVAGAFGGRRWIYPVMGPGTLPVRTPVVWVVVAPAQGIETDPVRSAIALAAELAGPLRARLVLDGDGVWVFRWVPRPGTRSLIVPGAVPTVAGWSSTGTAGTPVTDGPSANWRAEATGRPGYVVDGDYWQARPGTYQATVALATTVPVNVEAWDATTDTLLARRAIPPTDGPRVVTMPVVLRTTPGPTPFGGFGPFRIQPVPPPPGDQLELRVWSPGGGEVSVASLELVKSGR